MKHRLMNIFNKLSWQHQHALFIPLLVALAIGLLMVGTASTSIAVKYNQAPYYYMLRQAIYIVVGIVVFYVASVIPMKYWQRYNGYFWLLAVLGLILVFAPGIGHEVNGSHRWLNLGIIKLQASELAKLASVMYIASYLVRRQSVVVERLTGFMIPLVVTGVMVVLLLKEPDFGATSVLVGAVLVQLFIGGVKPGQFTALVVLVVALGMITINVESYRAARLLAYLDPWAPENVFGTGYQLTQSLIAFGRGGLIGVGLGESIQKLFFLPESHTDFVFAIWAEELGLIGALIALGVLAWLVANILRVVWVAQQQQNLFGAYVVIGIATLLCLQIIVNVGVNTGLLPTKGLTLPFYSYGGSSLIICCVMVGIVARIDREARQELAVQSNQEEVSYA